jgi:hypothetical protein
MAFLKSKSLYVVNAKVDTSISQPPCLWRSGAFTPYWWRKDLLEVQAE